MICPFCSSSVPDGSSSCPSCGTDLANGGGDSAPEFIFCEGCGARLSTQDRICPKCGRPAPGILSQHSAASDLAAGKTASFPRLTSEMIADAVPVPGTASLGLDGHPDPDSTCVLNGDGLSAGSGERAPSIRGASRRPLPQGSSDVKPGAPVRDDFTRPRRGRWVLAVILAVLVVGGSWFVLSDPMGVMPGFYASFEGAARDMFPSRQTPADGDAKEPGSSDDEGEGRVGEVSDSTLSEAEAFQRLSSIYAKIVSLQDGIGPVVDTYNGQYLAKDLAQRTDAAQGAFSLRKAIQDVLDEIDGLELADGSAYVEDVDHMRQLATWTYNRVDVLCRSWDISLGLPEGERPVDHQDEILAPLRKVEKVDGRAVDVISYEENVAAWMPREK